MRVLVVHNRYRSGDTSGENRVVHDEAELLRSAGHDVTTWEAEPQVDTLGGQLRAATDAVWSRRAAARVRTVVEERGIDVVHAHNLFPSLSPAVLRAARDAGAAVVVTLHNYRYLCLPGSLIRDGRACDVCVGRVPWRGVVHRCYRGSAAGSATIATSLTLHRAMSSFEAVARFAAVSGFIRDTYDRVAFAPGRIVVKPNFAPPAAVRERVGDGFVYLGRLAPEKGVDILLEAWRGAGGDLQPLTIVGSGPSAEALRAAAPPGVRFLGDVASDRVPALIRSARAVMIPSRWEEAAVPRVALEAYACGVPVVASDRGALPEGVLDGETGLVVPADDVAAWRDAATTLTDDGTDERLGRAGYALWRERYGPEAGLAALVSLYDDAVDALGPTTRS
jgi:glycosyltransferase involved in cell wall biosynthesis